MFFFSKLRSPQFSAAAILDPRRLLFCTWRRERRALGNPGTGPALIGFLFEEGNRKYQWKLKVGFRLNFKSLFSMKFYRKLSWTPNNQSRMLRQKLSNSLEKNYRYCLHCVFSYKQNSEIDKLWLNFATSFTTSKSLRKVLFISLMYLM